MLFSVFLPLSCSEFAHWLGQIQVEIFLKGHLLPMRVQPAWAEVNRALEAGPWEEAGKASIIRAMEFLEATAAAGGETCIETIQRLGRESSRQSEQCGK
jgi:hypothetical protein